MKSPFKTKKNIILIIFCFLLFSNALVAQEKEEQEKRKEWEKHQIKFTPTRLFNLFYPGIEFGYEYRYGRLSSQFSAAYLCIPILSKSCNGYRFGFEEKFFFKKHPKYVKFYLAIDISYSYIEQNKDRTFLPAEYELSKREEKREYAYEGNLDLQRQAIISNFKFGLQIKVKKLILEPSFGIGVGFQNVNHYNKPHPDDILFSTSIEPNITYVLDDEGFKAVPNFIMSFKIGYTF